MAQLYRFHAERLLAYTVTAPHISVLTVAASEPIRHCAAVTCAAHGDCASTLPTHGPKLRRHAMTTKLTKTLKREIAIDGEPYIVAIDPYGLKVTPKGKRKGHELSWTDLVSGEAALAAALNASVEHNRPPNA
jgi:hypothetical protein